MASRISKANVWCNGEVAYLAWKVARKIPDCWGFMITRVHETGADAGQRRVLPTWIAFDDQNNPDWNEQDSSVWPVQRFEWRDLTLRKRRDNAEVRPIDFRVHYEIQPVGPAGRGRQPVPASATAQALGPDGTPRFEGPAHQLYLIGDPCVTGSIDVTHRYGAAEIAFTNGILSTQNLLRQLEAVQLAPPAPLLSRTRSTDRAERRAGADALEMHLLDRLKKEIKQPASKIRQFLAGDVPALVTRLLDQAASEGGVVHLALYELTDTNGLVKRLVEAVEAGQAHVILSTAGSVKPNDKETPPEDRQPDCWDTENDDARRLLHEAAAKPGAGRVIDRMFNTNSHIGHNKFAVLVQQGRAVAALSGSTNWTPNGLCAQSNNSILLRDAAIAADYLAYWQRLEQDPQPAREPLTIHDKHGKPVTGAAPSAGRQGAAIRRVNATSTARPLGGTASAQLWCAPNTRQASVPKNNPAVPPDLEQVYALMAGAKRAILFLTFLPGLSGVNNIIGQAANLASTRPDLLVLGAISDPSAMPPPAADGGPEEYVDERGKTRKLPPPAIWWPGGETSRIAMIRAAAVRVPFGNLRPELLNAGFAIIHDKTIVIDPDDADGCCVITGSHNLGFKASYANDDNMLILRGNQALAQAYAVHVLDIYDHYVMRARLEDRLRDQLRAGTIHSYAEAAGAERPHGLLRRDDTWQDAHFAARPKSAGDYLLD